MKKMIKKTATGLHFHLLGVEPPKGFLPALSTLLVLLITGTVFYTYQEGWSVLDAFYFTVVTIATVGYGDFAPTTPISKIFTILLIFMGVGLALYVISSLSESFQKGRDRRQQRVEQFIQKLVDDQE